MSSPETAGSGSKPTVLLSSWDADPLFLYGLRSALSPYFQLRNYTTGGEVPEETVLWIHVSFVWNDNEIERMAEFGRLHLHVPLLVIGHNAGSPASKHNAGSPASKEMRGYAFLNASTSPNELLIALRRYLGPAAHRDAFTLHQIEVLRRIALGLQNKEIAAEMGISVKTVEFHRKRLMDRSGIHSTAGLTRLAIDLGLIPQDAT